jgi:hypothetical protein
MSETKPIKRPAPRPSTEGAPAPAGPAAPVKPVAGKTDPAKAGKEIGGPAGPEPTRYGDWEIKGRCIDF